MEQLIVTEFILTERKVMEKRRWLFLLILGCILLLQSCSAKVGVNEMQPDNPERQVCSDPRPEMCSQQYDPVCGQLSGGDSQTYSNWCSACSDKKVESYVPGECR
jgi:hypothetical protein